MAFSLLQSKTGNVGSVNATSVTLTTTATGSGNLLVAYVHVAGASVTITPPTGWAQVGATQGVIGGTASVALFYRQNSAPGVTSQVFSFSASCNGAVAFEEWSGVAPSGALDTFVVQQNAKATAAPTGTTAALAASGELAIWGLGIQGSVLLTYSAITNSYVEDTSANASSTEATRAQATLFYNTSVGSAATSSGATMSGTGGTGNTSILAVFKPTTTAAQLMTSPGTLSFSDMAGGPGPATQNVTLTNTGGTSSAWTSSIAYGSGSGWLGIAAASGTLAAGAFATIVFTCTTGALAVGTYTATVTFTATTGGATATAGVTFIVTSATITYSNYKNTIEPNLVAALAAKNLFNDVQLIGPDTTMASDSWLTSASADLASTLSGYARHAFPTGATDISGDSREVAIKSLVGGIYAHDPTAKPVIQAEMGDAALGPGQSVATYQYGVEMTDFAVQLARAGIAALVAYLLDDDMHGTQWGLWQITQIAGGSLYGDDLYGAGLYGTDGLPNSPAPPRPWFFPWSVMTLALVPGSMIYAPTQPTSNDVRVLAAESPQGGWTIVLVNRRTTAQAMRVRVPFAPVASTPLNVYSYTESTPLFVDTNGFPLPSGTLAAVLSRGLTVSVAANAVLILTQATTVETNLFDVKRPPLQKRR